MWLLLTLAVIFLIVYSQCKKAVRPPRPAQEAGRSFCLHVAGVSHDNEDGSSRQKIIRSCLEGEAVQLIPEPNNLYDPNAIKVCCLNGDQIGYIDATNAMRFAREGTLDDVRRAEIERIVHKSGTATYGIFIRLHVS